MVRHVACRALLLMVLAACSRPDPAQVVLAGTRTVAPPPGLARDAAQLARAARRPIVFNTMPTPPQVAIILAAPTTDWRALARRNEMVARIDNNCYASPASQTITCDADVFTLVVDTVVGRPADAEQRRAFALWLVGHELGHLMSDAEGYGHDQPRPRRRPDLPQQRREYAADCWMVHAIGRAFPYEDQITLERFAIDAINAHFRQREPDRPSGVGIIFDYTTLDPYDFVTGSGSHPDTVLRSVRLLHVAAARRNDPTLREIVRPLTAKLIRDPLWTRQGPCGVQ